MLPLDCLLFVGPVWISRISFIVSQMSKFYHQYIWVPSNIHITLCIVAKTLMCTYNLVKIAIKIAESPSREAECSKSL